MSSNWKNPQVFKRFSSIFTFSKNPLFKKNENLHIYIPWNPEIESELMFKLKAQISNVGSTFIPYMNLDLLPVEFNSEQIAEIEKQIEAGTETHLIMSNFDSIHVFRVTGVHTSRDSISNHHEKVLDIFEQKSDYKHFLEVDDVYVLEANHTGDSETVVTNLEELIKQDQTQKIFLTPLKKRT